MSSRPRKIPAYRLHKPSGQAVVRLDGIDHYLGKHDTETSHERYRRLIAEWLSGCRPERAGSTAAPRSTSPTLSVAALILAYWKHVQAYYVKNSRPTSEVDNIRQAVGFLRTLYGETPVASFGPLGLKAVRQAMIDAGRCRNLINKDISRIKNLFRWAVENELLPGSVYQALQAVRGLERGRTMARETEPVRPVPEEDVQAVCRVVQPMIRAMIELQLASGMRPGEVTHMRGCDLETSGAVWVFRPGSHKTEHHGRQRVILLGPKAQEVLRPWLKDDPYAYLFSPREAVAAWQVRMAAIRKRPLAPGKRTAGKSKRPKAAFADCYDKDSYRQVIARACRRAGVPPWSPNRLRHTAATRIRQAYGLEASRVVLGHASAVTTEVYAEKDVSLAAKIMGEIG